MGLPPELVTQLMNQGLSNKQFVSSIVNLQDKIVNSANRRPYIQALTEDIKSRPARETAALSQKRDIEFAKMSLGQLEDYRDRLEFTIKEQRMQRKSTSDIAYTEKLKRQVEQNMQIKGYDFKHRPALEYTADDGTSYKVNVPVSTMIDYSRMNDTQLHRLIQNGHWAVENMRSEKESKVNIEKKMGEIAQAQQTLKYREEDRKDRPLTTFTDSQGTKRMVRTSPEFAAQFSLQRQAAGRAVDQVKTNAQKVEFNQSRDSIKAILSLYGDNSGVSFFMSDEIPVTETGEYAELERQAATGNPKHVENLRQVHVNLRKMLGRKLHRSQVPPSAQAVWDRISDRPSTMRTDEGVMLTVKKEKGNNYLTIVEIQ